MKKLCSTIEGKEGGLPITGFNDNWWVGLQILHNIFTREHNVVCEKLRKNYPDMNEEELFGTSRLVVSALMAKIHTVEWTPPFFKTLF